MNEPLSPKWAQTSELPLSILLPIKNGFDHLPFIRSCLTTNCRPNDEILLVDDGSTDETRSYLEKWRNVDTRVQVIDSPGRGLISALNLGIRESRNNWIARFDVDDLYSPNRLEIQRSKLKDGIVAIFSDYEMWSPGFPSAGVMPSAVFASAVSTSLVSSQRTAHPSVLFSREAVMAVGGYLPEDRLVEDLSLWLRLSRVGQLISIPEPLLKYRMSGSSVSGSNRSIMQEKRDLLLRLIGVNSPDIQFVLENWISIFDLYSQTELPWQRRILLYRDISKLAHMGRLKKNSLPEFRAMRKFLLRQLGSYRAGAQLGFDYKKRRRIRRNF